MNRDSPLSTPRSASTKPLAPPGYYKRIDALRRMLHAQLAQLPRVRMMSPLDNGAGMVSFVVQGAPSLELQKRLAAHNIRTRVIGEYDYGWMRLSPHIYTSEEGIRRVVSLVAEAR